ncbi:MAG: TlpA disulfide reductase family protein [Planctomycetota bacterium]
MRSTIHLCMIVAALFSVMPASGQSHEADPAAMKAFQELIEAYRDQPGLTVKSTVALEIQEGDIISEGDVIEAEFMLGQERQGIVKLRGFECYLSDGTFAAIHEKTDHSYFSVPDDDSPYYTLMTAFVDLPFPHLAIAFGEHDISDVCMQFHQKAPWVQPTGVRDMTRDEKQYRVITMTSDQERVEIEVDVATMLISKIDVEVFGGYLVQPGTSLHYAHTYAYETREEPFEDGTFTLAPETRQRVDHLASLMPRAPEPTANDGGGVQLVRGLEGMPAPDVILTTMDNDAVDLEDLRGQVVVLDFWATWCGPCRRALPSLHEVAVWADDESLPVKVLTVNVWERIDDPEERLEKVRKFWTDNGFSLPVLVDYSDETAEAFGVTGIPTTVVIRSDGVVHGVHVGFDADRIRNDIQAALAALEEPEPQP